MIEGLSGMVNYSWIRFGTILKLLALTKCFLNVNGRLLDILEDTIVLVSDSTTFSCTSDVTSEIHWYHNGEHIYANERFYRNFGDRFRMEISANETIRTYTLVDRDARPEDSGVYMCREDEGRGESSSANLTVLNSRLSCDSNMNSDGYIGPNTCNLQQETMTFNCTVSFNGKPPQIKWRSSLNDSLPPNSSICSTQSNRINCILTLSSDSLYHGSVFTCQTTQPSVPQYNCNTEVIKVQYFVLDQALKPVEKKVNDEINCSVRSNQHLRFNWTLLDNNQNLFLTNNRTFVIRNPGLHWCNVSYNIRNTTCHSLVSVVHVPKDEENMSVAAFSKDLSLSSNADNKASIPFISIMSFALVAVIATSIGLLICKRARKAEKKDWRAEKEDLKSSLDRTKQLLLQPEKENLLYKEKPKLSHTIETNKGKNSNKPVFGIAILDDRLFTIRKEISELEVYSMIDFKLADERFEVNGLKNPKDLVSCRNKNCLFIKDYKEKYTRIFRANRNGKVKAKWKINKDTGQISIGSESKVIVAVWNESKILEYTCDGNLVREIKISPEIENFRQAVVIHSGNFLLIHGDDKSEKDHRVCIVDVNGTIIKSFGGKPGPSEDQLDLPSHLVTDEDDSIIVADRKNKRILLLPPHLESVKRVLIMENGLVNPWRMCLDMKRDLLLVADNKFSGHADKVESRILIYSFTDERPSQPVSENLTVDIFDKV